MAYITRNDMIVWFGEKEIVRLEHNISGNQAGDENVTIQAIESACAEADSYIAAKYPLPLPSTPDQLKRMVGNIARKNLYKSKTPEDVRQEYEDAISWLNKVSTNKAVLIFLNEEKDKAEEYGDSVAIFVV